MEISKRDWRIFKKNLPLWQERHMDRLNCEYCEILQGNGNPSEKFWELEKRVNMDKKSGVIVRMSRSNMINILVSLLNDNIIVQDDLNEFSDEIKEIIRLIL